MQNVITTARVTLQIFSACVRHRLLSEVPAGERCAQYS